MIETRTPGFHGMGVQWSAFHPERLAVVGSANYGLVGNGQLSTLAIINNQIQVTRTFRTTDSLIDLAWNENHADQILTASGDGKIRLFDVSLPSEQPIQLYTGHSREVHSVAWNPISKTSFASSSWDGTVKVWDPNNVEAFLSLPTSTCTYTVKWKPTEDAIISAACSNSQVLMWDLRRNPAHPVLRIPIHLAQHRGGDPSIPIHPTSPPTEALTHDWNKYHPHTLAVGAVDSKVRIFDTRMLSPSNPNAGPMTVFHGHRYAVRKVAWSAHFKDVLASGGYDMSVRVWRDDKLTGTVGLGGEPTEMSGMTAHTEFVTGIDWSLFGEGGMVASTAWDSRICVWHMKEFMYSI